MGSTLSRPEGVLKTKFGPVHWNMCKPSGVAFYVSSDANNTADLLMINGVFYTLRADYKIIFSVVHSDGWKFEYFHLSRVDAFRKGKWDDSATPAAIKAMKDELIKCWEKITTPELFKQAAIYAGAEKVARIEGEIEDLEKSLKDKWAELDEARQDLVVEKLS